MENKGLLLAGFLAAIAVSGCATTAHNQPSRATANGLTKDPNCMAVTGSLIPPRKNECSANGRSYTSKDMQQTGSTSAADALGTLNPSIKKH